MTVDRALDQYLSRYAEREARLGITIPARYSRVLVVPVLGEDADFVNGMLPAFGGERGLMIVVVNASDAAHRATHERNHSLLDSLRARGRQHRLSLTPPIDRIELPECDLLLVDRASPGQRFAQGQGVGLARRIGSDLALALKARGSVSVRGFGCSDADVVLPADYFAAGEAGVAQAAAAVFAFRHTPSEDAELTRATQAHELFMRYYVLGLASAGSAYAYHSIGSTLYVEFGAYAKVRGFPKRKAGEDFYLLDKLAKLNRIRRLPAPCIEIRTRSSERVPFGTGPAARRLMEEARAGRELRLYAPRSFELLRELLGCLVCFAHQRDASAARDRLLALPESGPLLEYLDALDFMDRLRGAAAQAPNPEQLERRLLTWFDALRTLRLIHTLRDHCHPLLDFRAALRSAPFIGFEPTSLSAALSAVQKLEKDLSGFAGIEARGFAATCGDVPPGR